MITQRVNQFRSLRLLHTTLLMGVFILLVASIFLHMRKEFETGASLDRTLQVVAVLVAAGGVIGGTRLFKARLAAARQQTNAEEKLNAYRAAAILQWVLAAVPALFAIISFMFTGNYAFVALAAALIIYLALTAPAKVKIMLLLQLSQLEAGRLEGGSV